MEAFRDFIGAMTLPEGGLFQRKGCDAWWKPVTANEVPAHFENPEIIETAKCSKWRYQQWVRGKWGRWRPVYNFKSVQSPMERK